MRFKVVEEFKSDIVRDIHYDKHVLGQSDSFLSDYSQDILFSQSEFPDSEEGRKKYEEYADELANKEIQAGYHDEFDQDNKDCIILGYIGQKINKGSGDIIESHNIYLYYPNKGYGDFVSFIPSTKVSSGNLILTCYRMTKSDYENMYNHGCSLNGEGKFIKEFKHNIYRKAIENEQKRKEEEIQKIKDQNELNRNKAIEKYNKKQQKFKSKK